MFISVGGHIAGASNCLKHCEVCRSYDKELAKPVEFGGVSNAFWERFPTGVLYFYLQMASAKSQTPLIRSK